MFLFPEALGLIADYIYEPRHDLEYINKRADRALPFDAMTHISKACNKADRAIQDLEALNNFYADNHELQIRLKALREFQNVAKNKFISLNILELELHSTELTSLNFSELELNSAIETPILFRAIYFRCIPVFRDAVKTQAEAVSSNKILKYRIIIDRNTEYEKRGTYLDLAITLKSVAEKSVKGKQKKSKVRQEIIDQLRAQGAKSIKELAAQLIKK